MPRLVQIIGFLLFCFFCSVSSVLNTGPSSYFSDSEAVVIQKFLLSQQLSDGTFGKSVKDTHYSVRTLLWLQTSIPNKSQLCSTISSSLPNEELDSLHHSIAVLNLLDCKWELPNEINTKLDKLLNDVDSSLSSLFSAVSTLYFRSGSADLSPQVYGQIVSKILQLRDAESGLFRASETMGKPSTYSTALALTLLSKIASKNLENEERSAIEAVLETPKFFESLKYSRDTPRKGWFDHRNAASLRVTSTILQSFAELARLFPKTSIGVPPEQISALSEFFLQYKYPQTIEDSYFFVGGLHGIAKNRLPNPLVLTIAQKTISAVAGKAQDNYFKVRVTDLLGNFAVKSRVFLIKAVPSSEPDNVLLANQEIFPVTDAPDCDTYRINFQGAKPEPGFYDLSFSVTPLQTSKFVGLKSVQRQSKIITSIVLSDFEISVIDVVEDVVASKTSVHFGQTLTANLQVDYYQKIFVTFKLKNQVQGKPIRAQQAFLRFINVNTNHEVFFVSKFSTSSRQNQLSLVIEENLKQFDYLSGEWELELIVGDSFIQNPLQWRIGKVALTLPTPPPSYSSSRAQQKLAPLPELTHQFRQPEKRPSEAISFGFTALVLSPLLLLFFGLFRVGANIKRFPTSFFGLIYALSFEACIILILFLFGLYWLCLNMFQTLAFLAVLAVPTVIFGQRTLRLLSEEGDKQRKAKKE